MITTLSILPSLSYHVSFVPIILSFNCLVYLFGFMTSKVTSHFPFYMTFNTILSDSESTKQGTTQINGEVNTGH